MRASLFTILAGLAALTVLVDPSPMLGQKKKKDDESRLNAHIQFLEAQIKDLQGRLKKENKDDSQLHKKIIDLQQDVKERDKKIADLYARIKKDAPHEKELAALESGKVVHTLVLRLKSSADAAKFRATFKDLSKALDDLPEVRGFWLGPSLDKNRDDQVGMIVILDSVPALQKLVNEPQYKNLRARLDKTCEQVSAFDFRRE